MKNLISLVFIIFSVVLSAQTVHTYQSKDYKAAMQDKSINFYEVVRLAESHFESIDKSKKGSGYKPFQRWKVLNEYKYYPSGERSQIDPAFVEKEYQSFQRKNKVQKNLHNGEWEELGPRRIDSISGHYAAGLGRVEDLYVDPLDSNVIYVGSRSGGFWFTNDGGQNWTVSTDTLVATGVNTFDVSPSNSDSILINVRNPQNGHSHGIYQSADGGLTWTLTPFNHQNLGLGGLGSYFQVLDIKYHPRIKDLVFVGTSNGIYRSTNNLQNWTLVGNSLDATQISFHPTNDSIIYLYDNYFWVNSKNIIQRSTDFGLTYSPSNFIQGNNNRRNAWISVSPDCPDCVYFATDNGVWKSTDKGINFQFLSNSPESCRAFAVSDIDTSNMVYGYVDLDASTDGGNTFINRTRWSLGNTNGAGSGHQASYRNSSNYIHADLRNAIAVNGVFYVATDGFVSKSSDNGVTWTNLGEGLGIRENYNLGVSQSNYHRTISGSQDNGTSINTEKGWLEFYGADGMEGFIHPLNDDWMIGSFQYGGRRLTTNGGQSSSGNNPSGSSNAYWIAPMALDPNNQMNYYDFRSSVYLKENFNGPSTVLGSPTSFTGDIEHAAIANNNSKIMYVSQDRFIDKSIDGGKTFVNVKRTLPNYSITDIAIDPNNDDVVVVTYARYQQDNQKVFMTNNGGNTWTNITANLGNMPINSVVIDHSPQSNIYLGAELGIYTKAMNGTNWVLHSNGFPNVSTRELDIHYGSNTLRAATWGRGLWEVALAGRNSFPAIVQARINSTPSLSAPKTKTRQFPEAEISYSGNLSSVYVEWSQDTNLLSNSIPMSNTKDSTWKSTMPLPNGPDSSHIFFRIVAVGANQDTSKSYRYMYELRPYEVCAASGLQSSVLHIINASINNVSTTTTNDVYSLDTVNLVDLYLDSSYSANLTASFVFQGNDFGVWIDFNSDGEFSANEMVLNAVNNGVNATQTFTVPNNAFVGDTVRIRCRLSVQGTPQACGTFDGEVEDYLGVIKDGTTGIAKQVGIVEKAGLFPNPNDGNFQLRLEKNVNFSSIQIHDISGRLVFQKRTNLIDGSQIDSQLESGIYLVRLIGVKKNEEFKLIVRD